MRVRSRPGTVRPWPSWRGGVEDGRHHGRRAAHEGESLLFHPRQDGLAIDLALHHVAAAHGGDRIGHAPAVAVEHRQRVEQDVAVADVVCQPNAVALSQQFRCVNWTPFGRAVVPEV